MLAHNNTGGMYTVHSSAAKFYPKNAPVSPTFLLFSLLRVGVEKLELAFHLSVFLNCSLGVSIPLTWGELPGGAG